MSRPQVIVRPRVLFAALLAALFAALVFSAAVSASNQDLVPVPEPDLDTLEPAVRDVLTEARASFEQARASAESDRELGEIHGQLGAWYQVHGLDEAARAAYINATILAPQRFEWLYLLAGVYEEMEQIDDAIVTYGRALERDPTYAPALVRKGLLLLQVGDPGQAERHFRSATRIDDGLPAAHAGLGRALLAKGDNEGAIEALEFALRLDPEATALYAPLAQAYRGLGRTDRARELLARRGERQAAMPDPVAMTVMRLSRSAEQFFQQGMALGQAGDHAAAVQLIARAIELNPEPVRFHQAYGEQLFHSGDLPAARAALQRAAQIEPDNPAILQNLGVVQFKQRDFDAARETLAGVMDSGSEDVTVSLLKARADLMAGHVSQALSRFAGLAGSAGSTDALQAGYWFAMGLLLDDRCGEAEQALLRVWNESGESHGPALMALARVRSTCAETTREQREQALDWAQWIDQALPGVEGLETLAMAFASLGRSEDAEETQALAIFEAHRRGVADQYAALTENMERYTQGHAAVRPFAPTDPVFTRLD